MTYNNPLQKLAVLLLTSLSLGLLTSSLATAAENPFTVNTQSDSAVVVSQTDDSSEEGKSDEGDSDEGDAADEDAGEEAKCGGEGKCGEGKCGG